MERLAVLLSRYVTTTPKMGEATSFPVDALQQDLRNLLRANAIYFKIVFTLLVSLLLVSIGLLAYYLNEPTKAFAVIAGTGISIPYLLRTMLRMWETKTYAEALIAMTTSMETGMVRTVVKTLTQMLSKKRLW